MDKKILVMLISLLLLFSITGVNASEKITATPSDTFAFYGSQMPAAQTHSFAVEVDGKVYYIDDVTADKLATYSPNFAEVYNSMSNKDENTAYEFENDKAFDFEYTTCQEVGLNSNANVIIKIYNPDGQEI